MSEDEARENPPPVPPSPLTSDDPLPYESGSDRARRANEGQPSLLVQCIEFVFGCGLSLVGIGFVSGGVFLGTNGFEQVNAKTNFTDVAAAVVYFILAAIAAFKIWSHFKSPVRARNRWFVTGVLIGAGVTLLLEGICFTASALPGH